MKLNAQQQKAIEYNKGPLLIVAGAGTGKTTTIIEKIKHLILKEKARPEEILALTFTDKAANEMEERVDVAMPYGYFQMNISTFHAFADEMLKNDITHIGLSPNYSIMTQAQSIVFLKKELFKMELHYFRPVSNPTKFLEGMFGHFSRLRDENISPEEYSRWIKSRKPSEDFTKEQLEQYKELAYAYEHYQKAKIEQERFDFADLIFYLYQLLKERPGLAQTYRKRFKHILVDEFQDTNIAQYELIKILAPPNKQPNLTVVGDDSQAIYTFRGASVSNILNFIDDYKDAKQITLLENYRSNQAILDYAYKLIQHNNPDTLESKLGISKELKAASLTHEDKDLGEYTIANKVNYELFAHEDIEADWIAKKIRELRDKKNYSLSDFAILVRANNYADAIVQSLRKEGIAYQFLGPGTLFKQGEVKDLIAYLKVLDNPEDTVSLFRILSMDYFAVDNQDLVMLLSFSRKTSLSFFQAIEIFLSFTHEEWYRSEYAQYKEHLPLLREETKQKLIELLTIFKGHLSLLHKQSAGRILYMFMDDTKYLEKVTNPLTEKQQKKLQNIAKFFNFLKRLETQYDDPSVFTTVEFINTSLEMNESPVVADTEAVYVNAVNILSVHAAKGLEFPVVFMPDLVQGRFPTRNRREKFPVPEELIKEDLPEGNYHVQEERRLFYVGLTRAEDLVFLTSSDIYGDGVRKRRISPFVYETLGIEEVEKKRTIQKEEKQQLSIFDFGSEEQEPVIAPPPKVTSISYSRIQTYKLCPLKYKYQYVLNIPTPMNAAASFGNTIHRVLQKFYEGYIEDPTFGKSHLLNLLEAHWSPIGYYSKSHQNKMKEEAKKMLQEYLETFHNTEVRVADVERFFKVKVGSSVYLTGKIDRVDQLDENRIEIVDYKTGNMPDVKKLRKDMQLSIYALAAMDRGLYHKKIDQIDLSFHYLQTGEKITLKKNEKELEQVKSEVLDAVAEIEKGNFEPHVGPWCDWCDFRMICEAWQ